MQRKSSLVTDTRLAYLYAIITVLMWSTVASAFKITLRHLSPMVLLFYSTVFSIVTLAVVLSIQNKWSKLWATAWKEQRKSLILGFCNPFLYYLILFKAYDLLPAQEAQALNYTWALTLTLLSVLLLGHQVTTRDWVAGGICYLGVLVIATRGDLLQLELSHPLGVGLALLSTVIWAVYWIENTKDQRDPVIALFGNFSLGLPWIALVCWLFADFALPSYQAVVGTLYIGCFEMGITFVCWSLALKKAENASQIANLIFLSPFLSLVFIYLLVGEEIFPSTLIGLVLIIGGLVWQKTARR